MRRFSKRMTETEAANAVAMMLRTNQHEIDVDPGVGFFVSGLVMNRKWFPLISHSLHRISSAAVIYVEQKLPL